MFINLYIYIYTYICEMFPGQNEPNRGLEPQMTSAGTNLSFTSWVFFLINGGEEKKKTEQAVVSLTH